LESCQNERSLIKEDAGYLILVNLNQVLITLDPVSRIKKPSCQSEADISPTFVPIFYSATR